MRPAELPARFILKVSTSDWSGGAERVAWNLFQGLRARGDRCRLAVGFKRSGDPDVFTVSPETGDPWRRLWNGVADEVLERFRGWRGAGRLSLYARRVAAPGTLLDWLRGHESHRFPGTWDLLSRAGAPPDLLHAHNLHGGYFDLRALPMLSRRVPTVLTLHDTWTFTGHCSYTLDCERWREGCGQCPYLDTHPPVRRDATAHNWAVKKELYERSRLWVATPSRWLLQKAEKSILAPALQDARVIPNGVDLEIHHARDRGRAREELGIPPEARVLVFVGNRFRARVTWKDFPTVREAAIRAGREMGRPLLLLAVGDDGAEELVGSTRIVMAGHWRDPRRVAQHLRAADVALHAAKPEAENFPNVVLEASACGIPVVATAVGGIPEQVVAAWDVADPRLAALNPGEPSESTGILIPASDAEAMGSAIVRLLGDEDLRTAMGRRGAARARAHYGLDRQVETYRTWYEEILEASRKDAGMG